MTQQVNNSLWSLSRTSDIHTNILEHEEKVDVAIIGGGFTGCSAALRLAEAGTKVSLLEAEFSGFGGSGRNVGLTNAGLWINPEDVEKAIGKRYGEMLNHFLSTAPDLVHGLIDEHGIECEALRNGTLHLAHNEAGLKALEDKAWQINARGGSVMLLDRAATFELTAAENYLGAIHDMRAGTIQPLDYCHGLMMAARAAGANIYTASPALKIRQKRGQWHIKTPQGIIMARRVLIATNAYLEHIYPQIKSSFTPMYYAQLATDPLSATQLDSFLPGKHGTWDTRTVMRSYRTDAAGRLIIGTIGNIHMENAPLFKSWADKMIRDTFPKVGPVNWTYKWAGRIACSEDYIPNIHDFGQGLYSISGFSGRGISPGTAFGRVMADFLLGRVNSRDLPVRLSPVKSVPFNKIRELFYECGSQLSRLYDHLV
jgi:L-pipecolate oxidase